MALRTIRGELVEMPERAVMGAEMILPNQRNWQDYEQFLEAKVLKVPDTGFIIEDGEINPILKPHQRAIIKGNYILNSLGAK